MIVPILLCGGAGKRLWPLSRKSYPKQFANLTGKASLFQQSAERLTGDGFAAPIVITNEDFRFIVTEQLAPTGIKPGAVLVEPSGRNTAPAVLAAALWLAKKDPKALMLVAPADHVVPDAEAFRKAVAAGTDAALDGQMVTFGIHPDRPETGYGYLELAQTPENGKFTPVALKRFVEKPDAKAAADMLASGCHLWNAGIFLFTVDTVIKAFHEHAPGLAGPVGKAVDGARADLDFWRLDAGPWAEAEAISIDYAVMERASNLAVVPYANGWSDLGGWDSVWRETGPDDRGVTLSGPATAIDCTNTLLRSEDKSTELVGIGLDKIIAVATSDAVLVADMSKAQHVGRAVTALNAKGAGQAESFPRNHRPWGWFETLVLARRYQVKRIVVHAGAALSLQSHVHRFEHWIVVTGTARVTIDDKVTLLTENQSAYIPLGAVHRLENPGKVPLELIEVQTGPYLGEDDIIRYEDRYARD